MEVKTGTILGAVAVAVLCAGAARGQERPAAKPGLPEWGPSWRIGDWWVIKVFQRDLREAMASPEPADGGQPVTPEGVAVEPLPGLPPMRDGVPVGYKPGNRFRFEIARREAVRYDDDAPDDPPEEFWVVAVRTLEGRETRRAELWYARVDLTLAKVVLEPGGPRERTRVLRGRAQLWPSVSQELGFPLDWPFLPGATEPRRVVEVPDGPDIEQRVRRTEARPPDRPEAIQLRLAELPPPEEGAEAEADRRTPVKDAPRVHMEWTPRAPFWTRLASYHFVAEVTEAGRKR